MLELWERLVLGKISEESLFLETKKLVEKESLPAALLEDIQEAYRKKPRLWNFFKDWEKGIQQRCWTRFYEQDYWNARISIGAVLAHSSIARGMVGHLKIRPGDEQDQQKGWAGKILVQDQVLSMNFIFSGSPEEKAIESVEHLLMPLLEENFGEKWCREWLASWRKTWVIEVSPSLSFFLEKGVSGNSWSFPISALLLGFLFRQRLSPGIVLTGDWDSMGNAKSVERIEDKMAAILSENEKTQSHFEKIFVPAGSFFSQNSNATKGLQIVPVCSIRELADRLIPDWQKNISLFAMPPWGKCVGIAKKVQSLYQTDYDPLVHRPLAEVYMEIPLESCKSTQEDRVRAILGVSGSGKSSFCKHAACLQAERYLQHPNQERLPLLLSLRNISSLTEGILPFFDSIPHDVFIRHYSFFPRLCSRLHLWLDGLDESKEKANLLSQIAILSDANARCDITCRDYFFESLQWTGSIPEEKWSVYRLAFSHESIEKYLQKWGIQEPVSLPAFLTMRPLFLAILVVGFPHARSMEKIRLVDLYRHCTRKLIEQRQSLDAIMDMETHWQFLEAISLYLWQKKERIWTILDWANLKKKDWLSWFPLAKHFLQEKKFSDIELQNFFLRESVFQGEIAALRYIHESFSDYLLASAICRVCNTSSLNPLVFWEKIAHSYEMIEFLCQISLEKLPREGLEKAACCNEMNRSDYTRILINWIGRPLWYCFPISLFLVAAITMSLWIAGENFSLSHFSWLSYFLNNPDFSFAPGLLVSIEKKIQSPFFYVFCFFSFCMSISIPFVSLQKKAWKHLSILRINALNFLGVYLTQNIRTASSASGPEKGKNPLVLLKQIIQNFEGDKKIEPAINTSIRILQHFLKNTKQDEIRQKDILSGMRSNQAWRAILPNLSIQRVQEKVSKPIENDPVRNLRLNNLSISESKRSGNLDGICLIDCDLSGWQASGISMKNANLQRCCFKKADLSGACLQSADLRWCDFSGADLSNADLSSADLRGTVLQDADCSKANFSQASIRAADFQGTNLAHADLQFCKGISQARLKSAKNMANYQDLFYFAPLGLRFQKEWLSIAWECFLIILLLGGMFILSEKDSKLSQNAYFALCLACGSLLGLSGNRHYPVFSKGLFFFSLFSAFICSIYCNLHYHVHLRFGSHGGELWGLLLAFLAIVFIHQEEKAADKLRFAGCTLCHLLLAYTALTLLRITETWLGQLVSTLWSIPDFPLLSIAMQEKHYFLAQISLITTISLIQCLFLLTILYLFRIHTIKYIKKYAILLSLIVWLNLLKALW
ncbi:MAG: pentapeptide repeat-containing protein [Candidatus Brocadiae bacterium]|nr:pentapeptide repeat-containing protein [Candidatus Brocadiia bacterium]